MNHPLKSACIAGAFALASTPVFADAFMVDVLAQQNADKALHLISAKMDHDAKDHLFNITIGTFGVVDTALGQYDADYESVLSARGMALGAAAYGAYDADVDGAMGARLTAAAFGNYDADYDGVMTKAGFFSTAALGAHDAGYEQILSERGILVGAAVYGQYDGDYEPHLTPVPSCLDGAACF